MPKAKDPTAPPETPPPSAALPKRHRKSEAAFDVWLQRGLHEIFDKVASEPVPEELLKLIEEDRKR